VKHSISSCVVGLAVVVLLARSHQAAAQHGAPAAAPEPGAGSPTSGKVVETMDSGGYTYVQVDDGSKKIWAAAPQFKVAVGDMVSVPDGMPMEHFESKTLKRTFDVVYFVPGVQVLGSKDLDGQVAAAHAAAGHDAAAKDKAAAVDLSNIKKAEGGQTVAELFAKKAALTGKDVAVRGRVVKFSSAIMGKNWVHVQDGSGSAGSNDLTVSTSATAAVGDLVLVRGKLVTDRDLGAGYHYDVIIEDGTVAVE
jgi:hypothetical protein